MTHNVATVATLWVILSRAVGITMAGSDVCFPKELKSTFVVGLPVSANLLEIRKQIRGSSSSIEEHYLKPGLESALERLLALENSCPNTRTFGGRGYACRLDPTWLMATVAAAALMKVRRVSKD